MEALQKQLVRLWIRQAVAALALAVCLGCVTTGPLVPMAGLCDNKVCEIVATWSHQVMTCPDPTHNGALTPGLVGRLYLFDAKPKTIIGDGSVQVTLYNEAPMLTGGEPEMLEQWNIDHETLRRLVKKDPIGKGYTLFLPWASFKPGIKMVHLKLRYDPLKGAPMFADSGPLTLENPDVESRRLTATKPQPTIQQAANKK